mmetsp:Transcript_15745/g.23667  ORF Transcript_15745/g.23667 Transcript_15745/m.23667 type:complete len:252 (-) Transcript_15745:2058-2813(-)
MSMIFSSVFASKRSLRSATTDSRCLFSSISSSRSAFALTSWARRLDLSNSSWINFVLVQSSDDNISLFSLCISRSFASRSDICSSNTRSLSWLSRRFWRMCSVNSRAASNSAAVLCTSEILLSSRPPILCNADKRSCCCIISSSKTYCIARVHVLSPSFTSLNRALLSFRVESTMEFLRGDDIDTCPCFGDGITLGTTRPFTLLFGVLLEFESLRGLPFSYSIFRESFSSSDSSVISVVKGTRLGDEIALA